MRFGDSKFFLVHDSLLPSLLSKIETLRCVHLCVACNNWFADVPPYPPPPTYPSSHLFTFPLTYLANSLFPTTLKPSTTLPTSQPPPPQHSRQKKKRKEKKKKKCLILRSTHRPAFLDLENPNLPIRPIPRHLRKGAQVSSKLLGPHLPARKSKHQLPLAGHISGR